MPDENDLKVASDIGELSAEIKSLTKIMNEHARESRNNRKEMYLRLEKIKIVEIETNSKIGTLIKRMDRADPILSQLQKWRERGIGAFMLIAGIASVVSAVLMTTYKALMAKFGVG